MDQKWLKLIKQVISQNLNDSQYNSFIFGSWAQGVNRPYSDLDIGILGEKTLPTRTIVKIKNDLEDSQLPYRIDLVDFARVQDNFKKIAMRKVINL